MAEQKEDPGTVGCSMALWGLFVLGPIWWYILYRLMVRTDASDFDWWLFYAYVPSHIVGIVLTQVYRVVKEKAL